MKHRGGCKMLSCIALVVFLLLGAQPSKAEIPLTPLECGQEPFLRSIEGSTLTSIEFVNATPEEVSVYWLNYEGQRVLYTVLPAKQTYVQFTYLTHPWVVTGSSGRCLAIFMPVDGPGRAVVEGCGDDRSVIFEEYRNYGVGLEPQCDDFTQSARSSYFAFSELNTGDYAWALIRQPLLSPSASGYGLDKWREAFGGPRHINSAYRNPARNAGVGGAAQSRHMYGDAADLRNDSGSITEWKAMKSAARIANADFIEPLEGPCGLGCLHADWRSHSGAYAADPILADDQSSKSIGRLTQQLKDRDWSIRRNVFYALLRHAQAGESQSVRSNSASDLSELPREVKTAIIRLATLEHTLSREHAVSYHEIGSTVNEEYLTYYADLIRAVSSLKDERSLGLLLSVIDTGCSATDTLAELGRPAVELVIQTLHDSDADVRHAAAFTLARMVELSDARNTLDRGSKLRIKQALTSAAMDESPFVRITSVDGLAKLGDRSLVSLIEELAQNDPYDASAHGGEMGRYIVRSAAASAIDRLRRR